MPQPKGTTQSKSKALPKVEEKPKALTISDWIERLMILQNTVGNIPLEFCVEGAGPYDSHEEQKTDLECTRITGIHTIMHSENATPLRVAITIK